MSDKIELPTPMITSDTDGPSITKDIVQANRSFLTAETYTASFSEEGDEKDHSGPCIGAIRIDDFLLVSDDEKDSISVVTSRTSLLDCTNDNDVVMPDGIPREIFVLDEDAFSREQEVTDIHQRLLLAETLAQSYKAKMQSTEELTDNLHEYLKQAQTIAEDLLADRNNLLQQVHEMEKEERTHLDQYMLMKVIMASSLCYYMLGGSPIFLTCSVGLNLIADTVNAIV